MIENPSLSILLPFDCSSFLLYQERSRTGEQRHFTPSTKTHSQPSLCLSYLIPTPLHILEALFRWRAFPRDISLSLFSRSVQGIALISKFRPLQTLNSCSAQTSMSSPSPAQPAAPEEKKETRPWNQEEKQLFYKGFNKYYKKFQQISEMVWILCPARYLRRFHRAVSHKCANSTIERPRRFRISWERRRVSSIGATER